MEYDNDDTGVVFEKQHNQDLEGTGQVTENGERQRIAMIKADLPDGSTVRDIFVYVGRLWDNPSGAPNAPQFTGLYGEKSIAAWANETEKGRRFNIKLTNKIDSQSQKTPGENSELHIGHETTFNKNSPEVKSAVRTSNLPGDRIWNTYPLPQTIEVSVKKVLITKGQKYSSGWNWPMYEIETDKGVFISAHGPDNPDDDLSRIALMRKTQNNGKLLAGNLSGGGSEVFWNNPDYKTKKLKVITGPSDRVPDWTWIYFIHEQ